MRERGEFMPRMKRLPPQVKSFPEPCFPAGDSARPGPSRGRIRRGWAACRCVRRRLLSRPVSPRLSHEMKFTGTRSYVAPDDLKVAVNAAITLQRPLLVKGEPGTGKTVLALEVASALGVPILEWHIKSTT